MRKSGKLLHLLAFVMAMTLLVFSAALAASGQHKVYFAYNDAGATAATHALVDSGKAVAKPADPTREGYAFTGWYTDYICTKAYDFASPVTSTLRLFAGWEPTAVTLTCYLQDEQSTILTLTAPVGQPLTAPEAPVRDGYEFTGWYANAAGTRPFDFTQTAPAHDLTVYAGWTQESAKITFVLYDDVTIETKAEFNQPVATPADPEREDYAFAGWYASATGADLYDFASPVTGNARIYARWTQTVATVTFDGNYEGSENTVQKIDVGASVKEPKKKPKRDGHEFIAWYSDVACTHAFDFSAPITSDTSIYAGWKLEEYVVKFDMNYDDGEDIRFNVGHGQITELPEDPEREGYAFTGWYTDKKGTELFDPAQPIVKRTVVYAAWQSTAEAEGERVISFQYNYDDMGEYAAETYTGTRRIKEPDAPLRPGYYFAGWAKDPEGTTMFNFSTERSTASMTLYAVWLKGYTFEAEYTFLDGKPGQGSSDNCMGTDIIQTPKDVVANGMEMGMSNLAYVGKLYYNGAYLDFQIHADAAIDDAILVARLTPDLFDMRFTDETWQVIVNDERLEYGKLNLVGAVAQTDFDEFGNTINGDMTKRPFENYVLTTSLKLKEGENLIRLMTNNTEDHGGTFNAETPLIDCLYIYSNTPVSWAACYPENMGKTMADVLYDVTYDTDAN